MAVNRGRCPFRFENTWSQVDGLPLSLKIGGSILKCMGMLVILCKKTEDGQVGDKKVD